MIQTITQEQKIIFLVPKLQYLKMCGLGGKTQDCYSDGSENDHQSQQFADFYDQIKTFTWPKINFMESDKYHSTPSRMVQIQY